MDNLASKKALAVVAAAALTLSATQVAYAFGVKGTTTYSGGVIYSGGTPVGSYCTGVPTSGKYDSASYSGNSGCVSTVPGTDSDGDTMDDTWEQTYSLDEYDSSDRYADGDGDGSTNAREYAQGADPTMADSDSDGVSDGDDPDPDNAGVSEFSVDATYQGNITDTDKTAQ